MLAYFILKMGLLFEDVIQGFMMEQNLKEILIFIFIKNKCINIILKIILKLIMHL